MIAIGLKHDQQNNPDTLLEGLTSSPFSIAIIGVEPPIQFLVPKFKLYNDTLDTIEHIWHYK